MNNKYEDYIKRQVYKYGSKFDSSDLNPEFIPYLKSGQRVEVEFNYSTGYKEKFRGFIGVTTGWKPCFILLRTKRSIGSSYTIHKNDKVVKIITKY